MRLDVVRHAHAGSRSAWDGIDAHRPLSKKGRRQAEAIADRLAADPATTIHRLVSSPSLRCVQTLEPLADRLGLAVEGDSRLLEGTRAADALALARELAAGDGDAVVCSHGDVIPEILRALRAAGTRVDDPFVWPKGSTWRLTGDHRHWATASYQPPPQL
ncbi:MAG TPA: phosphoglycerate mutase family protein [Acidimicrobiales bacterium]